MAIALSLDAFSLALVIGVLDNRFITYIFFSIMVGILHFIMPSIGALTNTLVLKKYFINGNLFLGVTLLILAFSMFLDQKENKENIAKSNIIFLAFSVSIDSYFAGLGLKSITGFSIIYFLVFSLFSCIISLAGCILGNLGRNRFGKIANYIAIVILLLLGVKYVLFN